MITNHINEQQSSYSYGDYLKEYIDQSISPLANSGQRFGINANGIKYVNKTCKEIFELYDYDIDNYLLELHLEHNSLNNIKIIDKNTRASISNKEINFIDKMFIKEVKDNETINTLMNYLFNDIDAISNDNSYIIVNDSTFTGFLKGKLAGERDVENISNSKLIYFQYDINSNTLLHYIVTYKYGTLNEYDDWYIVYKLDYKYTKYELSVYLYRLEWLVDIINEDFDNIDEVNLNIIKNLYNFKSNSVNQLFSFFNNYFEDFDNFSYTGRFLDKISFLNYVFNYDNNKNNSEGYYQFNTINIDLPNNSAFEDIDINSIYSQQNDILGYISKSDFSMYFINLQNLYTIYIQLYSYFNQITFFNTTKNHYIYQYIIYKLYSYLRNELGEESDDVLYIPLSYMFNCFISDTNEINIYYLDNIYVKLINDDTDLSTLKNQIYYVNKKITNHVSIYRVCINYNITNIINNILIYKLYTLPYLNRLNNWVIDDLDTSTSIYQNQYSGIKELYIYNYIENEKIRTDILNFSDESIKRNLNDYKTKTFTINQKYFVKFQGTNVQCQVNIPDLSMASNDIIEFFKNTIIISICDKKLLKDEYYNDYQLDYIYSLWRLNENLLDNREFELISFENDSNGNPIAFDPFNNMSYVNKEQTYKYIQNLYTSNKFNTDSSNKIDNQICLVTRNKNGSQYHPRYYNNLNVITEYVPELNVNENGDNPNYQTDKFIQDIENTEITNILYPIYNKVFVVQSITQVSSYLQEQIQANYNTFITVNVNSANNIYSEWLTKSNYSTVYAIIQEIINKYEKIEVAVQTQSNNSSNLDYYNEYVFNKNVPSVDYKELLLRNVNTLNRVNILSVENDIQNQTKLYNGFIGSKFNNGENKNTLYISTNSNNINIGNDTLFNPSLNDKFDTYETLQIDEFNNINFINSNKESIKLNNEGISIDCSSLDINTKTPIELKNNIINNNYSLNKKSFINSQTFENITTYSTTIIPQGFLGNSIFITYNYSYSRPNLLLYIQDEDFLNINNWMFMPIYGAYISNIFNRNIADIIDANLELDNLENKFIYFYNSIILDNLIPKIFDEDLLGNNPIVYVCNNNNKILEIKNNSLGTKKYHLLVFNDQTIKISPQDINKNYKLFNHQLNITLAIDNSNNTRTIFINFENHTIDTLDKMISYNNNYNSLSNLDNNNIPDILDNFNKYLSPSQNLDLKQIFNSGISSNINMDNIQYANDHITYTDLQIQEDPSVYSIVTDNDNNFNYIITDQISDNNNYSNRLIPSNIEIYSSNYSNLVNWNRYNINNSGESLELPDGSSSSGSSSSSSSGSSSGSSSSISTGTGTSSGGISNNPSGGSSINQGSTQIQIEPSVNPNINSGQTNDQIQQNSSIHP